MELSGAHGGVNNNLYATFPKEEIKVLARIVILVVLVPLVVPRWTSQKTTVTVFRQPRGTLLVMGATTMVQLTQAPSVLACTSVRTGLRAIPSLALATATLLRRASLCRI